MVETKDSMFLKPPNRPLVNEIDYPSEGGTESLDQESEEVMERLQDESDDEDPDINQTVA